jgi:thiamine pyrophosphokinase
VSLIPLGGDVKIGRTSGLKWGLEDEMLRFGPARGISNVMLGETAVVEVEAGMLLCVHLMGAEW